MKRNIEQIVDYVLSVVIIVFVVGTTVIPLLPAAIAAMNLTGAAAIVFSAIIILLPIVIGVYLLTWLVQFLRIGE